MCCDFRHPTASRACPAGACVPWPPAGRGDGRRDADLQPFLEELPVSELYPVGETSWPEVSAAVKKHIGQAVAPGGNPAAVLTQLQSTAQRAQ